MDCSGKEVIREERVSYQRKRSFFGLEIRGNLRDVTYSNYFPVGMGGNFPISSNSTVEQYEHIQAVSVGVGTTCSLYLNQKDVESCPQKDAIFKVIRTWENARAANAFKQNIRKQLADPAKNWSLKEIDSNKWELFQKIDGNNSNPINMKRAPGY